MVSASLHAPSATADRHPPALWTLFRSEMWERFSYYGMRALLVLYLVHARGYGREDALQVYAVYTGLVYLTPIAGGYIADRWLGFRKSILIGGIVMMLGNLALTQPSLLHVGLGLLIVGNGFFKPNISSLVGRQYGEHDPRRDAGFTYFYMGINLGAFLAPLVAGWLGERVTWSAGFAAAAVGMAFGVVQFTLGQKRFGTSGLPPGRSEPAHLLPRDWLHVALLAAASIPFVLLVLSVLKAVVAAWALVPAQGQLALPLLGLAALLWNAHRSGGKDDVERVLAIVVLGCFMVFFWMGFEQAGGTMNLFADRLTDRVVFGWEIPASFFQSINPVAILALGPILSAFWTRLDQSSRPLASPAKMGIGMLILGSGFVVLAIAQQRADRLGQVGPLWLTAVYVLHTIGELCLSPIGLSMVTKVSPARMVGLMMGIWFCFIGAGNYLAGTLESLLTSSHIPLYQFLIASSVGPGLLLLALVPVLRRWMHGHA